MADEPLPGTYPLTLYRGDSREWTLDFTEDDGTTAVNMTGHTWKAQVRETTDSTAILLTFTVNTTNAATGRLVVTLPAAQWDDPDISDITPTAKWKWDLEATRTADGFVRTYLTGKVKVLGDVAR